MDEVIGEKGGHRDLKRTLVITREKKKKLQAAQENDELKELERKVKKKNFFILVRTLPIVIGGSVVKQLYDTSQVDTESKKVKTVIDDGDREIIVEGDHHKELGDVKNKQETRRIITLPDGRKVVVNLVDIQEFTNDNNNNKKNIDNDNEDKSLPLNNKKNIAHKERVAYPIKGGVNEIDGNDTLTDTPISPDISIKLDKLKSRKIVDEYEKELKDIRFELRKTISDYNVLVDDSERITFQRDAEKILERLSQVIEKIEELKRRIKIENLDKYDDNYIYTLIEGYLREFNDGHIIDEIKDSPLYVMISKKLDELDKKRGELDKKVNTKKDELEEKEKNFDSIKEKYYSIDKINSELLKFQYEQDIILREVQEKVKNATSVRERVEAQVVGLNRQSHRLMRLLAFQMMFPGARSVRALTATTAAYLYFYNNMIRPNTVTRRYRVISVKNYHDSIKSSIDSLDDALSLLTKTSKQVDNVLRDIEEKFKDYIGFLPECDELISNLRKIKRELSEKEYEMDKLKKEQEKELEKNDAKVKTIGEYPVN